ncbi:hypothetical protein TSUD_131320 [Trifolium subterraneum]|uniref:Cysteine proteinase inhibitor n=1 Tax=Trifolium subterraneum TaxID=3900 RepID=A0A2Z6NL42_TRISU|nr:hypothetical protein TSUD_131320 [Trifolium subterraneum]
MASILQKLRVKAASIRTAGVSNNVGGSRKYLSKYITEFKSNPFDPPTDCNLARFAVDQHNLKKNANLEFVKAVVDKMMFLRTGETFYYVTLKAKDGEKKNANLKFVKVLDMKTYLVEGMSYHIILEAKDGEKNIDILEFVKVVDLRECYIEDEVLYYMILLAKVGEKVNVYAAEILDQDCGLKELKEFNLVGEGPFDDSAETLEKLQDMFEITNDSLYKISRKYNVSYLNKWGE